ncbi:MAG: Gfo/Idh/MocA family protein, partial [Burkholderiales bacterium]
MSDESRTRREFIRSTAVTGGALLASLRPPAVHAAGSDAIGVGLVGCGGRGRGAAADAVKSSPGVRVLAIGDAFADRVAETRERLKELGEAGIVPEERAFVGLDAYQRVIATPGVNYVILATPPGFRPLHLEAAVAAGKHVFTEKPVAVDGPGIRSVLATAEAAKTNGLGVGAGTQRRHEQGYVEAMRRVKDGGIGEILSARAY